MNLVPRISGWHRGNKYVKTELRWYDLDEAEHGFPKYVKSEPYTYDISMSDREIVDSLLAVTWNNKWAVSE